MTSVRPIIYAAARWFFIASGLLGAAIIWHATSWQGRLIGAVYVASAIGGAWLARRVLGMEGE